jgi:hypothetical protein
MSEEKKPFSKSHFINVIILLLLISNIIFASLLIFGRKELVQTNIQLDTNKTNITNQPNLNIQMDIQNGTGENGVAADLRTYLKKNGIDIVEMGNYKTNDIMRTIVIDRKGNLNSAKNIASVLGINEKNIVQQINKNLFLDATLMVGKDYTLLKPYKEKKK